MSLLKNLRLWPVDSCHHIPAASAEPMAISSSFHHHKMANKEQICKPLLAFLHLLLLFSFESVASVFEYYVMDSASRFQFVYSLLLQMDALQRQSPQGIGSAKAAIGLYGERVLGGKPDKINGQIFPREVSVMPLCTSCQELSNVSLLLP